jgi:hypothetical protein
VTSEPDDLRRLDPTLRLLDLTARQIGRDAGCPVGAAPGRPWPVLSVHPAVLGLVSRAGRARH